MTTDIRQRETTDDLAAIIKIADENIIVATMPVIKSKGERGG